MPRCVLLFEICFRHTIRAFVVWLLNRNRQPEKKAGTRQKRRQKRFTKFLWKDIPRGIWSTIITRILFYVAELRQYVGADKWIHEPGDLKKLWMCLHWTTYSQNFRIYLLTAWMDVFYSASINSVLLFLPDYKEIFAGRSLRHAEKWILPGGQNMFSDH